MSAESFQDLKDWMQLQLRKIGRNLSRNSTENANEEEATE
jgi:hypothetical protein